MVSQVEDGKMFNAEKIKNDIIQWIAEWFNPFGETSKAVIGISGGKDSTIVAALCSKAIGPDRVIGLLLPNGNQSDLYDAVKVCELLKIKFHTINIKDGVDTTLNELKKNGIVPTEQTIINIPPRERTKVIRAVAQSCNGFMVNTCNLSEDYIGYFTIGGDGDGDFSPLGRLTATEVVEIGHCLGLPKELVDKTPSDGLCGKTDEDSFGFSYAVLDKYIRTGEIEDMEIKKKIDTLHEKNKFKLEKMSTFQMC